MNDVPRVHRRGSVPVGLLGMIVLVATIELGFMRGNLDFMDNVAVSWKYTGKIVKRKAKGNAILCFGDSMLKFGLLPRVLTEGTGQKAYGLAVLSGSAPSSYFLLRRALETGARPTAVIVDFARGILGDGPASETRPYPWVELLKPREAAELCWTAKDPNLVASLGLRSVLHSVRQRHEIRAHVLAKLRGKPTDQRDVSPALWRNWNTNDGGQANPKVEPFADVVIPENHPIKPGTWRCDPVNEIYVHRFIELAQSHGIKVYWMLTPVTPGTFSSWVHSGDEQLFINYVRAQQARFSNLVVLDARDSGYERSVFVDGVHLDRDGASALSVGVAEALSRSTTELESERTQWVKIPAFDDRTPRVAIEDVTESRLALKAVWEQRKRR
ncbi:hypothetical protein SAMN05444166_6989 [Singulisphaera sp. GP187]|uniref:hypothetical protein n=1 Tax=Singulisphaera sp. GP187 TaxID=1882752 RepID=UPI00092CB31B|nr:hypothetical protein [Singulisphaera sp. GP187]SIO62243.1 hypothetical protein SAMN05444166_6989 [Singulisphaera sp. GP187]